MIRLGLRLTLTGGARSAVRLVLTAAGVALGTALLLSALAGINAVNAQNARFAWLATGSGAMTAAGGAGGAPATGAARRGSTSTIGRAPQPLWWLLRADGFGGQIIGRIDVAATGPRSPVPPGIAHLPGPGRYYASPALTRLLRSTPASELADRFPGHQAGVIGPSALPGPGSLVVIVGRTPAQLARIPGATEISGIQTTPPSGCDGPSCSVGIGIDGNGIDLILAVVALALLLPVLVFIAATTLVSAAGREARFAALRLAGATARQVSVISAVESLVAATAGTVAGFGLFFAVRPAVAAIPLTSIPFYTSDLSLSPADAVAIAVGVPVAAAVAALIAMRRVRVSPLGVTRRVTPAAPRAWRVLPLLAGVGELACFAASGRPATTQGQIDAYVPGFLLIMVGLITAGPWLTMAGARVMAARARRPAALIAARRLADDPRTAFRAISGLILALFVTTTATAVITSILANEGAGGGGTAASHVLVEQFASGDPGPRPVPAVPGALVAGLRSITGVHGVAVIHTDPLGIRIPPATLGLPTAYGPAPAGLVSCAQLARAPALGRCPAGARAAAIPSRLPPGRAWLGRAAVWPAAALPPPRLRHLPVESIAVSTNGSLAAIERARTALEVAYPRRLPPATIGEGGLNTRALPGEEQLANVVIVASLPIAGCTLAVSVAAGLTDRKRPFSLLRLAGAPFRMLRRVVALESAVPLLAVAVVAMGTGFLAAQLFLTTQLGYSLRPPGPGYYLLVLAGLAAALGIIAATLPLLNRITGPETARSG